MRKNLITDEAQVGQIRPQAVAGELNKLSSSEVKLIGRHFMVRYSRVFTALAK